MLVLSRKIKEKIQIGDNVTVTILQVKGRTVRIGIEAPKGVRVMRAEIPINEFAANTDEATEPSAPPVVAEAAMSMAEMEDGEELATMDTVTAHAPLSLHTARRFRIITPKGSKAPSLNRLAAVALG